MDDEEECEGERDNICDVLYNVNIVDLEFDSVWDTVALPGPVVSVPVVPEVQQAQIQPVVPRQAREFKCHDCEKSYKHAPSLSKHKRQVHGGPGIQPPVCATCFVCHEVFDGKYRLKQHIKDVHESMASNFCDVEGCARKYKRLSDLKRHKKCNHSD